VVDPVPQCNAKTGTLRSILLEDCVIGWNVTIGMNIKQTLGSNLRAYNDDGFDDTDQKYVTEFPHAYVIDKHT
jgi:hypothetical protein